MKTAIKLILITLNIFAFNSCALFSQQNKSKDIYIEWNKDMKIKEHNNQGVNIEISISVFSKKDSKISTYNFKIDNLSDELNQLTFNEIDVPISKEELLSIDVKKIKDLESMHPCDLHYLFSENSNIYLIKNNDKKFTKYKLIYWSTQRGWEPVNTN